MSEIVEFMRQHWQASSLFGLLLLGYIVFEFMQNSGGKEVSAEQAIALYNHEQALILDIRSKEAFDQGHIIGAHHITADQIDAKIKKLQKYAQKPVIVVCGIGRSSLTVVKKLEANGFTQALSLSGGMSGWQAAGLPLTTQSGKTEI